MILTRPRKEPGLGQGVIILLSEPLAALQEGSSKRGDREKKGAAPGPIRIALWKYMQHTCTWAHKSDGTLA